MIIFLIGYRCSGKTSVGKHLADLLHWPFVDTDELIVCEAGQSIAEFVKQHGWAAFRAKEREALAQICLQDRQVAATGGGIVLDPKNIQRMRDCGWIAWLRVGAATVVRRMRQDSRTAAFRPALTAQSMETEIRETLIQRAPAYRQAMDFGIDSDYLSVGDICQAILKRLSLAGFGSLPNHFS